MRIKFIMMAAAAALVMTGCKSEPAFEQTEEVGPYTVTLIEKNVWHVEDCNSENPAGQGPRADGTYGNNNCSDMYIVRGKDKALLIDLSNNIKWAENADQALRDIFYQRAGDRQKLITITHNHGDHTGMLYAFKDEQDVTFLLPENDFSKDKAFPEGRKSLIGDLATIDLGGGMVIECVETPGHTPGSIVFFIKGHDIAFSGDAIGSGGGVWIFSLEGFKQYTVGVSRLISYINDPANKIDQQKLTFYGGHDWQKKDMHRLDMQYLLDMQTLCELICKGEAEPEAYANPMLDSNFKYGSATITWRKSAYEQLLAE